MWKVLLIVGAACGESFEEKVKRETAIKQAAEDVCKDTKPIATSKGKAIMQAIQRPDDLAEGQSWSPHPWKGLPAPSSIEDIGIVVCRVSKRQYATSCSYDNKRGGTYSITIYKVVETLTVRDAKTAEALGEQKFEGPEPLKKCDTAVTVSPGEKDRDVMGEAPSEKDETAFIKQFVEKR